MNFVRASAGSSHGTNEFKLDFACRLRMRLIEAEVAMVPSAESRRSLPCAAARSSAPRPPHRSGGDIPEGELAKCAATICATALAPLRRRGFARRKPPMVTVAPSASWSIAAQCGRTRERPV